MSDNDLVDCPNCSRWDLTNPCFVCARGSEDHPKTVTAAMSVEIAMRLDGFNRLLPERALLIRKNHGLHHEEVEPLLEVGRWPGDGGGREPSLVP